MNNKGFTLAELMMVLVVGGTATVGAAMYYDKVVTQNKRQVEAKQLVSYSKAVANFVRTNQALIYNTNATINISPEQLIQYNIIDKNEYKQIKDPSTGDELYPCAVIFKSQNMGKLQGFVYYRTDGTKMNSMSYDNSQKTVAQLMTSMKTLGASGSLLYKNKSGVMDVKGFNGSWSLSKEQIDQYFNKTGYDFLSDGLNSCKGANIATPSYTISLNSVLDNINGALNPESSIKQNINEIVVSNLNPNNTMTDLDLDSNSKSIKGAGQENNGENKLMFQSNPDCVMNPSILSTMQDYDPNYHLAGEYNCNNVSDYNGVCGNIAKPNIFGCRNKQLAIGGQNLSINVNGQKKQLTAMTVNGFESVDTSYATQDAIDSGTDKRLKTGYLGGINADSIQATAQIPYAASCDISEIGSMATQKKDSGTDYLSQIHNLNQSLLVCQKSLLCSQNSIEEITPDKVKTCWLPISTTTVTLNFSINDKILALQAPDGFYIKPGSVVYTPRNHSDNINSIGTVGVSINFNDGGQGGNLFDGVSSKCRDVEERWCPFCQYPNEWGWFANPENLNTDLNKVPAKAELLDNRTKSNNNGINVWVEQDSFKSFNTLSYFSSAGGYRGHSGIMPQLHDQSLNWENRNSFTYKFGQSVPYIASSLWDIRQSWYNSHDGYGRSGCVNWRTAAIVAFPYYITKLTISNDIDIMPVDSNNPPPNPIPPIPTGQCGYSNIPDSIKTEGLNTINGYVIDTSNGNKVVLSKNSNISWRSENLSPTNNVGCKVTATANYCSADSQVGCKYTLEYHLANSIQINWNGAWSSGTVARTTLSSGDVVVNRMCNYVGLISMCDNHLPITIGDSGIVDHTPIPIWNRKAGTYSVYHTEGTCQSPDMCSDPKSIDVYKSVYYFK